MRHSYDTVVIGSGYGGGVAASRMARAGKHVCVLERGKERWPGEYPVSAGDALKQLHVSGEFSPKWLPGIPVDGGDPTGMYHLILGKGQNAVVGNGKSFLCVLNFILCGGLNLRGKHRDMSSDAGIYADRKGFKALAGRA